MVHSLGCYYFKTMLLALIFNALYVGSNPKIYFATFLFFVLLFVVGNYVVLNDAPSLFPGFVPPTFLD